MLADFMVFVWAYELPKFGEGSLNGDPFFAVSSKTPDQTIPQGERQLFWLPTSAFRIPQRSVPGRKQSIAIRC